MIWTCSDCGRDLYDHTLRDVVSNRCRHKAEPQTPKFTASEVGYVNPEAVEATGEVFNLRHFRPDFYVPEREQRLADRAGDSSFTEES